ncbi:MAG: redoxin family protein [Pyrinomonadaceae bacterium]
MTQSNNPAKEKGALRTDQDQLINESGFSFSGYERDPLYLNLGNKKFKDISGVSGIDSIADGRAAVFADFDNDGDYDVFLTTIQAESHLLFRNNVGQANNWLRISLEGGKDVGRDAFSGVVRVKTSAGTLTKIKSGGSGFISEHDPRLLFGLGKDERAQSIEVTWPNGKVENFTGEMRARMSLLLREGKGRTEVLNLKSAALPDPLTRAETLASGLKIAVGRVMPDLQLKSIDGAVTSLRRQLKQGRRLLINVWATWCAPCASEMPELQALNAKLSARGVDLVGLNVDTEPETDVKSFVASRRLTYPILIGGVQTVEQLYATDEMAVPLSILVNDRGIITELIPGWSAQTRRRFGDLAGATSGGPASRAKPN